jgi:hypothetical protein
MTIPDIINALERTANATGKALALPTDFYSKNRSIQRSMISDAYDTLEEYF